MNIEQQTRASLKRTAGGRFNQTDLHLIAAAKMIDKGMREIREMRRVVPKTAREKKYDRLWKVFLRKNGSAEHPQN